MARRWVVTVIAGALALSCVGRRGGNDEVVVFAAASLTAAFEELASAFEAAEGTPVAFSFEGSTTLAAQLIAGAPADVFASADEAQMARVEAAGRAIAARPFATNRLVLITPADDPAGIREPADLARPGVRVVLGAADVPAGRYARALLDELGILAAVESNVVSNEDDVKGVLTKVRLGEADAGIVYVTDVTSERDVRMLPLPAASDVPTYLIASIDDAPNAAAARAFVAFVGSPQGRRILEGHGFGTP